MPGTSFSDLGLTASSTYNYTVAALDAKGNVSGLSNIATAITRASSTDMTSPTIPAGLVATSITANQLTLSWSVASDNVAVAGYRIYRNGVVIASVTGTTYADTNLTASTTYNYTVAAFDATGNLSSLTTAISPTTLAVVVTPPPRIHHDDDDDEAFDHQHHGRHEGRHSNDHRGHQSHHAGEGRHD